MKIFDNLEVNSKMLAYLFGRFLRVLFVFWLLPFAVFGFVLQIVANLLVDKILPFMEGIVDQYATHISSAIEKAFENEFWRENKNIEGFEAFEITAWGAALSAFVFVILSMILIIWGA